MSAINLSSASTLQGALKAASAQRWRDSPTQQCQAKKAAEALGPTRAPESVTKDETAALAQRWHQEGLSAATINKRLSCLGVLGVVDPGHVRPDRKLKWWLNPTAQKELTSWLRKQDKGSVMADYIDWTCLTGLRVEETLRLQWYEFMTDSRGRYSVTVPGMKNSHSQATLALSEDVNPILARRRDQSPSGPFRMSYIQLYDKWDVCRNFLGVKEDHLATLKALRRSAARYLHIEKGMPLDLVRTYLRHENIETTMGYLRLTGGYREDEMRRYL